jgi:hypothetical protein
MGIWGSRRTAVNPMAENPKTVNKRIARMRQDNSFATAPPAAIFADAPVKNRLVGKSGSLHIPELAKGVRVNYLQVNAETFVISSRSESELRTIAAGIPKESASPFASVSNMLRGRKFELATSRDHATFQGSVKVPAVNDDELLKSVEIEPARRVR